MKKWSETAWEAAAPVYEKILEHPFIKELTQGTLPREKFLFYLEQDAMYIDNYTKVLAHIASRLYDKEQTEDFVAFAQDGINVERAMHETYLAEVAEPCRQMSKSCLLYTSVLDSCATRPVEVEAAAILPCFWVYQAVGEHIKALAAKNNPYEGWIATYGDPAFEVSNRRAIAICDALAEATGEGTRRAMTDIFVMCTRMEWLFWDSAYRMEQWEI